MSGCESQSAGLDTNNRAGERGSARESIGVILHYSSVVRRRRSLIMSNTTTTLIIELSQTSPSRAHTRATSVGQRFVMKNSTKEIQEEKIKT